jgi:hypothetical protein
MVQAVSVASALAERCIGEIARTTETLVAALDLALTIPGPRNPHLLAAYDAALTLGRQLDLFRKVWTATARPVRAARLPELLRGAPGWERAQFDFTALSPRTLLSPPRSRIAIGCLLLALEALPEGGTIRLARAGRSVFEITIDGPGAAWPEELPAILADEEATSAGLDKERTRLAALLAAFARGLGVPLSLTERTSDAPPPLRIGWSLR